MEEEEITVKKKKSEAPPPRRRPKKIVIPRRTPSIVIPEVKRVIAERDLTEEPYQKPKRLRQCQKSPLTLYELAAAAVDALSLPAALNWNEDEVADWMANEVGLPQYKESIFDNHINGMRLLMFEDPSRLPQVNIHDWTHIKVITRNIRKEYSTEFIKFCRSIGLPPRKPLTHYTWFKSRTGPSWGIRKNWSRCDLLRWMKILLPEPIHLDHWDLVWYHKPEFPKLMFARIPKAKHHEYVPRYKGQEEEICREYLAPRKFRFMTGIPESDQMIWMERQPELPAKNVVSKKKKRPKLTKPTDTQLSPKPIDPTGLAGKELLLARRKMNRVKFLPKN